MNTHFLLRLLPALSFLTLSPSALGFELMVNVASDEGEPQVTQILKAMPEYKVSLVAEIWKRNKYGNLQGLNRAADDFQWEASCEPIHEDEDCQTGTFSMGSYRVMSLTLPKNMGRSITITVTHGKKQAGDPATRPATVIIQNLQAPADTGSGDREDSDAGYWGRDGGYDNEGSGDDSKSGGANMFGGGGGGGGFSGSSSDDDGSTPWNPRDRDSYGGGGYGYGGGSRYDSGGSGRGGAAPYAERENPEPVYCKPLTNTSGKTQLHCRPIPAKQELRVRREDPRLAINPKPKSKQLRKKPAARVAPASKPASKPLTIKRRAKNAR